ncbi:MAG: hypothetical protein Q8M56_17700 [Desulfobacterales bacterium]|jgi:hypothetical protein|nr:hypothetical protein [Desulfobacterales bacterium]
MKKTVQILRNEEGSVILVAMIIMMLLLVMGISATNMSSIEMQILRNAIMQKQEFYFTEGGMVEVATDVNLASADRVGTASDRSSEDNTYAVTNIDTPVILTETEYDATRYENPTAAEVNNYTDATWPVNYNGSGDEYAYRVYYKGQGPMPKGYGAGFGSYIFDITVRKQSADAVATTATIINEGFRKIGPKG